MKTRSHDGLLEFAAGEILMRVQTAEKNLTDANSRLAYRFASDWSRRRNIVLIGQTSFDEHFELTGKHKISNQRLHLSVK